VKEKYQETDKRSLIPKYFVGDEVVKLTEILVPRNTNYELHCRCKRDVELRPGSYKVYSEGSRFGSIDDFISLRKDRVNNWIICTGITHPTLVKVEATP
jgi:hypothetical protein